MKIVLTENELLFLWDCPGCGRPDRLVFSKDSSLGQLLMSDLGLGPKVQDPYRPYSKTGNVVYKTNGESDVILRAYCLNCFREVEVIRGAFSIDDGLQRSLFNH